MTRDSKGDWFNRHSVPCPQCSLVPIKRGKAHAGGTRCGCARCPAKPDCAAELKPTSLGAEKQSGSGAIEWRKHEVNAVEKPRKQEQTSSAYEPISSSHPVSAGGSCSHPNSKRRSGAGGWGGGEQGNLDFEVSATVLP